MKNNKNEINMTEKEFLESYDPSKFERPSVTADVCVFCGNVENGGLQPASAKLLLIKRGGHPFLGKWALPGGFVNMNETLGEGAVRELREETGISGIPVRFLDIFSQPNRDPRTRIITAAYLAAIPAGLYTPTAADDAADARWFSVSRSRVSADCYDITLTASDDNKIFCEKIMIKYTVTEKIKALPTEFACFSNIYQSKPEITVSNGGCRDLASDHALIIAYALRAAFGGLL